MPRYATDGHFDYARAHELYTAGRPRLHGRPLSRSRDGLVRLPGTATSLRPIAQQPQDGETPYAYVIRYRETDIVTLYRDGRVRLDNGGHPTVTTVRKMHEYTPEYVTVSGRDIIAKRADAHPRIVFNAATGFGHLDHDHTTATLPAPDLSPLVEVTQVDPTDPDALVCGECGRAWAEDVTPAGRCPWEHLHVTEV